MSEDMSSGSPGFIGMSEGVSLRYGFTGMLQSACVAQNHSVGVERDGRVCRGVGVGFRPFGEARGDRVLMDVVLSNGEVFVAANLMVGEASLPDREF